MRDVIVNKQSQFPAAGIPHHCATLLFHHSHPMPIVQNKANCPKRGTEAVARWRIADRPTACRPGPATPIVQNEPNSEDEMCETNPIPGGAGGTRPRSVGRGAFVQNKANFPWRAPVERRRSQSCETKPIPGEGPAAPGGEGRGTSYKQTQFAPQGRLGQRWSRSCKTKPIGPVGRSPGERNVRNKPNCPKRGTETVSESWPPGEMPIIPLFQCSSIPVRRLSCKTNPIPAVGPGARRTKCAKRSQFLDCGLCETKPISEGVLGLEFQV